jgi:hypothetical protein
VPYLAAPQTRLTAQQHDAQRSRIEHVPIQTALGKVIRAMGVKEFPRKR